MNFNIIGDKNDIAYLQNCDEIVLKDLNSVLDLMATAQYETECNKIVVNKVNICDDFFT